MNHPIPVQISQNREDKYNEQNSSHRYNKIIKRSNKVLHSLSLPSVMNCNPQSLYNKKEEFMTFIKQKSIDLSFISESGAA